MIGNASCSESIGNAVTHIAASVQSACPHAKALILTGSTARGEAAVAHLPDRELWLSDAEFLVVVDSARSLPRELERLNSLAASISASLAGRGIHIAVELTPAPETYFSSVRPELFGYELRLHGRQLYGAVDYLARIPAFSWQDIPREDAWRLLSNRMVEWLHLNLQHSGPPLYTRFYTLTKQYLDLVTSLGIFAAAYESTYRGRAEAVDRLAGWISHAAPEIDISRFAEAVRIAAEFRSNPAAPRFASIWSAPQQGEYAWMYLYLPDLLRAVWIWELAQLTGTRPSGCHDILPVLRRVYNGSYAVRGWARLTLRPHLRSGGCFFRRLPRLMRAGAPRSLVYACCYQLLASRDPQALAWVHKHLPIIYGSCRGTWEELAGQCVRNWTRLLRLART